MVSPLAATQAVRENAAGEAGTNVDVPARLGRYVVLERLGQGGMGVVFSAYDPQLDRKVAIKLLRFSGVSGPDAQKRLLREAQTMAKLSHPNVVAVHDAGIIGNQFFVAMDFVNGQTLRDWMSARHSWAEVLAVFLAAGRGLAAAHAAGVVHRDFKPENVMLHADGRALVMDFGLALPEMTSTIEDERPVLSHDMVMRSNLTKAGSLLGTPAYMSPEQFVSAQVDARSDQFSFCVAMFEALYGQHPFPATTVMEQAVMVGSGVPISPRHARAAPSWLRRILGRGMRRNPDERWRTIAELLHAIERRRQRGRVVAAAFMAVALVLLAVGYRWILLESHEQRQTLCATATENLVGVWDSDRKDAVRQAIVGTGLVYAEDVWNRITVRLDEYTEAWTSMHTEACQATHLRGEQSPALLDLRMNCLRRHLGEVRSLIAVLMTADADVVQNANAAVEDLPNLALCADVAFLQGNHRQPTTPETLRLRDDVNDAYAHLRVGRLEEGMTIARRALDNARELTDLNLRAEASLALGLLLEESGDPVAAGIEMSDSFFIAERVRNDVVLATVVINLTHNAIHRDDLTAAHLWLRHADALAGRLIDDRHGEQLELKIGLTNVRGVLAVKEGQLELAEREFNEAVALMAGLNNDRFDIAGVSNNLGNVLVRRGDLNGAETHFRRAVQIYRALLGENHPTYPIALNNIAEVHMRRGEWDLAQAYYDDAHRLLLASVGPAHPNVGVICNNLGDVSLRRGQYESARKYYLRATEIFGDALGTNNSALAYPLTGLGEVFLGEGRPREAVPSLERALGLRDSGDKLDVARTRFALARALADDAAMGERVALLATQARDVYENAGPAYGIELAAVDTWMNGRQIAPHRN